MMSNYYGRRWNEKLPPICTNCDYNLTGIDSQRCPECGKVIYWIEIERNAKQTYYALRQTDDLNDLIDVGPYAGVAGVVVVLFFWLIRWGDGLGRAIGVCAALATVGCGMQVFRARRVPEWAREFIEVEPKFTKAILVMSLGIVIVVLAVFLPPR